MRKLIKGLVLLSLLTSCSEPVEDRKMVNERFFGTVVSAKRVRDVRWEGVGNTAMNGAGSVARAGAMPLGAAADMRMGTGGMFSSIGSTLMSPFTTPSTNTGVTDQYLSYVIETEEGRRTEVVASDRRVYYPGDEVMVVRNQRGYSEVFPRDLSGRYPGGQ